MAGRYAASSLSRSLISSARVRVSALRSPPAVPRLRPPSSYTHRRRTSFGPTRNFGELGCTQSFLPISSLAAIPRLMAHLSAQARACCELSHECGAVGAAACIVRSSCLGLLLKGHGAAQLIFMFSFKFTAVYCMHCVVPTCRNRRNRGKTDSITLEKS
ncbi:hypothetical protein Cgig2_032593 [Carnegiea gigantea]|uniref:Uncharacterized protein n=1 Tax=Carnegiea gigantea TaxID=171969 RepID=A0A9Q1KWS5_9CARY|nr:hypothetical protein Cgig2_032593 [Carnegiea gigantea]